MEYEKLKNVVESVNGSTFAGLDLVTQVKLKGGKSNPMQGRVTKVVTNANTTIFSNTQSSAYQNMVKRRLIQEGKDPDDYTPKPRAWGERVGNTPFISHKDKYYLEAFFNSSGDVQYYLDDEPISKEEIVGLTEPKKDENSQGGLDNKIIIRTISLDSIRGVRLKNQEIK